MANKEDVKVVAAQLSEVGVTVPKRPPGLTVVDVEQHA